jgi:hypothetical protein
MLVLMMREDHFGRAASKEKAVKLYSQFALGQRYGDGEALKYSRATLLAYFDEFKAVAHLWAAQRLNQFAARPVDAFGSADGLLSLLGVAKTIGAFASSYVPARTKPPEPLIRRSSLLTIPDGIPEQQIAWR